MDETKPKAAVTIRPARLEDKADVIALTRTIWDGHDYVPYVWEEWLNSPDGILISAELDGRVVGLGRIADMGGGEWWLQGLRVDPAFEGRGIAAQMHEALIATWEEQLGGVLRLMTYRPQVKHLCARTGFHPVAEFTLYGAPVIGEPSGKTPAELDFRQIATAEAAEVLIALRASPVQALSGGLVEDGWEVFEPTAGRLERYLDEGQGWSWQAGRVLVILRTGEEQVEENQPEQTIPFIRLLAGTLADLPEFLPAYRRLGAALGYQYVGWSPPVHDDLLTRLAEAGFSRWWDGQAQVFERRLALP